VETITRYLFAYDAKGRLAVNAGFLSRLGKLLRESGYRVMYQDTTPPRRQLAINREAVTRRLSYRARQEECLEAILGNRCGQIWAVPGFGKMVMMTMVCLALQDAKIHITTKRKDIVQKIVQMIGKYMPCGQVGGGVCKPGPRVTVYTADSLHKSPADADVLLVDESHELMADRAASHLMRYKFSRNYGFTASPEGRFDGSDARLEAIFGQPIFELYYPEAVELGLVVPLEVEWCDVPMTYNPCMGARNDVTRKRHGIWRNPVRNEIIARKVASFPDQQVLVLVDTVEHAVYLGSLLPEAQLVYASMEEDDLRRYQRQGLLPDNFRIMDRRERERARDAFEKGEIRLAVATGVWAVGVDFTKLQVLIRADAGASEIASIQMPGRVSRLNQADGKEVGIVCDFHDGFDSSYRQKAMAEVIVAETGAWADELTDTDDRSMS
jgi:superfamily II DNA or RNA helicase